MHGLAGSARTWDQVRARLSNRYRVVDGDLPGHGQAIDLPGRSLDEHVRLLQAVVQGECGASPGELVLVGHSLGALPVLRLAGWLALRGSPPIGVVLVDPLTHGFSPGAGDRIFLPFTDLPYVPDARLLELLPPRLLVEPIVRLMFAGPVPEAVVQRAVEQIGDPRGLEAVVETLRRYSQLRIDLEDIEPLPVHTPGLVLHGAHDRLIAARAFRELAGRLGARLECVAGAGHLPHEEAPSVFCDLLESFLESEAFPGENRPGGTSG